MVGEVWVHVYVWVWVWGEVKGGCALSAVATEAGKSEMESKVSSGET